MQAIALAALPQTRQVACGLLIMTPLYVSLNFPVEGIGILIALDQIVNMFLTPTNVTANLTVISILTRSERKPSE